MRGRGNACATTVRRALVGEVGVATVVTREDLLNIIEKLPPGTEIFTRSGDNAWPTKVRVFQYGREVTAYMDYERGDHRNFPEGYSGAKEIT